MRKSDIFFFYLALKAVLLSLILIHASYQKERDLPLLKEKAEIVKKLELTDLCLFTEARYTRHLTQADLNTPFQDHPMSFEHFPSGSLVTPPIGIKSFYGKLD